MTPYRKKTTTLLTVNKIVEHDRNNVLSDNQYGVRSAGSTADILTLITHRINKA